MSGKFTVDGTLIPQGSAPVKVGGRYLNESSWVYIGTDEARYPINSREDQGALLYSIADAPFGVLHFPGLEDAVKHIDRHVAAGHEPWTPGRYEYRLEETP